MYLTTLPFYREKCIESLVSLTADNLVIMSGPAQIGGSVRTGISDHFFRSIKVLFLGRQGMIHFGGWSAAFKAATLIVDLNPRCLTAWALLVARRAFARRTLVWGHLHPRAGAQSRTAALRRNMRRLASGTVLYGYDSVQQAQEELPNQDVWVAPNSLYLVGQMGRHVGGAERNLIVYVGRLVAEKKIDLLIRAFAKADTPGVTLTIVGAGDERDGLEQLARDLGCSRSVEFRGSITSVEELREIYSRAICAVSPGYAGLSLTQSLGFGVPFLVADNEPHAPEIELEKLGGVVRFEENSEDALADALNDMASRPISDAQAEALACKIAKYYSAESMAKGLFDALENVPHRFNEQGWPEDVTA